MARLFPAISLPDSINSVTLPRQAACHRYLAHIDSKQNLVDFMDFYYVREFLPILTFCMRYKSFSRCQYII